MKRTIYLDASVIGHVAGRLRNDQVVRARQLTTRTWWRDQGGGFDLCVSEHVLTEIRRGDPAAAAEREATLTAVRVLDAHPDAPSVAAHVAAAIALPPRALTDADHLAAAALAGMDHLLTWNFKHLINPDAQRRARATLAKLGVVWAGTIVTPQDLLDAAQGSDNARP